MAWRRRPRLHAPASARQRPIIRLWLRRVGRSLRERRARPDVCGRHGYWILISRRCAALSRRRRPIDVGVCGLIVAGAASALRGPTMRRARHLGPAPLFIVIGGRLGRTQCGANGALREASAARDQAAKIRRRRHYSAGRTFAPARAPPAYFRWPGISGGQREVAGGAGDAGAAIGAQRPPHLGAEILLLCGEGRAPS